MSSKVGKISMVFFVALVAADRVFYPRARRSLGIASGLCALVWLVSYFLNMRRLEPRQRSRAVVLFCAVIAISALVLAWVVMHP